MRDIILVSLAVMAGAIALGMLGCAYLVLEGFLLAARRRSSSSGDSGGKPVNQ
jgi:hypothetical protein